MLKKLKLGTIESNIWKFAGFVFTNKRITFSILGVYYLTIPDVEAKHIGLIVLLSNIFSGLFELPSGYLGDKIGHKKMLVIAKILMLISTALLVFASNLYYLVLSGILMSLSLAASSGTASAFIHNTLKDLNKEDKFSKILGKINSVALGVSLAFSATLPFLIKIDMVAPFAVALVFDFIGLLFALSFIDVKVKKEEIKNVKFVDVVEEAKQLNYISIAMFAGLQLAILHSLFDFRGPYQESIGVPVELLGVYYSIGGIFSVIIMMYSDEIKKMFKDVNSFEKYQTLFTMVILVVLALVDNIFVVITIFVLANALYWSFGPIREHFHLEVIRESNMKATLLSFRGQIMIFAMSVFTVVMGYLISYYSYHIAFLTIGIAFFVISSILYLNILISKRRREEYVQN